MTVENEGEPASGLGMTPHEDMVDQIQALWEGLSGAHQVALVLQLAGEVMETPYRPYLRHAMTQQWPIRPDEYPVAFPKFQITEDDLLNAYLDEEDLVQLNREHLQEMAETMRSHYIHDLFWPELRHVAGLILENLAKVQPGEGTQ